MKSALAEAQSARWIPSLLLPACLQSCSLVHLTGLSEHLSGEFPCLQCSCLCRKASTKDRYLQNKWFFQYKYWFEWCYSSFYGNEGCTEAACSFHIGSTLPACTLQSNLAGSASPHLLRSHVGLGPVGNQLVEEPPRCHCLLICWEHIL